MDHRKQIVGPVGKCARAAIAVGHETERSDPFAEQIHLGIIDIPDRHTVGRQTKLVMIGGSGDPADDTALLEGIQALDEVALGNPDLCGDSGKGLGDQRQPFLGCLNDLSVKCVHAHAATRNLMKYSRSLGKRCTCKPVSASIRIATVSMSAALSVARTNHMFSLCSR